MKKFCAYCGNRYSVAEYPMVCESCDKTVFLNPTPVVVVIQHVVRKVRATKQNPTGSEVGVIIAKRAIEPAYGKWTLVGGHVETNETIEEAAIREFKEETSLDFKYYPRYVYSRPTHHNHVISFLVSDDYIQYKEFEKRAKPCSENLELGIAWEETELGFPLHTEFLSKWFRGDCREGF